MIKEILEHTAIVRFEERVSGYFDGAHSFFRVHSPRMRT